MTSATPSSIIPPDHHDPLIHGEYVCKHVLEEDHHKSMELLQNKINESHPHLTMDQKRYLNQPGQLIRFLKARNWDVDKSTLLLSNALKWVEEFKPYDLDTSKIAIEAETGKNYRHGFDKMHRPIIYMKPRKENTKNYKEQIQLTVFNVEQSIGSMDLAKGVEQVALLIDFNGYSIMNAPPMSTTKEVLHILMDCYPERLGMAFMIDAPFLFNMAWRVLSPFIPEETKKKIVFISGSKENKRKALESYIPLETLEAEFGGDFECEYIFNDYWEKEENVWKARRRLHSESKEKESSIQQDDV